MSRRTRSDVQHLDDAQEHLRMLQQHLARGPLGDELIRDAVSHRLEVAVDAVGNISPDLAKTVGSEDWPKIVGMPNRLAHQYAEVDPEILRNTIENRLDDLIAYVGISALPRWIQGPTAQIESVRR